MVCDFGQFCINVDDFDFYAKARRKIFQLFVVNKIFKFVKNKGYYIYGIKQLINLTNVDSTNLFSVE